MESLGEWTRWAAGGIAGGALMIWGHITGRVKKLEEQLITASRLEQHIRDEERQFDVLFKKHDDTHEKINSISVVVARIEGKLSNNKDWQDHN